MGLVTRRHSAPWQRPTKPPASVPMLSTARCRFSSASSSAARSRQRDPTYRLYSLFPGRTFVRNRASDDQRAAIPRQNGLYARAIVGVKMGVRPRLVQLVVFGKQLNLAREPLEARPASRKPRDIAS